MGDVEVFNAKAQRWLNCAFVSLRDRLLNVAGKMPAYCVSLFSALIFVGKMPAKKPVML